MHSSVSVLLFSDFLKVHHACNIKSFSGIRAVWDPDGLQLELSDEGKRGARENCVWDLCAATAADTEM